MPLIPYIPSPHTWADPELTRVPILRADIAGAVALLGRPPLFAGHQFQFQQVPSAVDLLLNIDAEDADPYNMHTIAGDNTKAFPPVPGWYLVESAAAYGAFGTTTGAVVAGIAYSSNASARVNVGGGRMPPLTSSVTPHPDCARLVAIQQPGTDWIGAYIRQSTGNSVSFTNAYSTTNETSTLRLCWVASLTGFQPLPVPAVAAWPAGELTAAFLNANIRDTINFLTYPPVCEYMGYTGGTSAPSAATIPVASAISPALDIAVVDNYSAFSVAANTWTAPVAGVYYAYMQSDLNTLATSLTMAAGITVTSALYNSGNPVTFWGGCQAMSNAFDNCATVRKAALRLNAGDTIKPGVYYHDSGGNPTVTGTGIPILQPNTESLCRLITVWQGA